MYHQGRKLIKKGDWLDNLILIYSGQAHLYGYYERNDETIYLEAVKFKAGSWYGDY